MLEYFYLDNRFLVLSMVFVLGAIVGSFLNVCVYRIPRRETIVTTPSHCPACGHPIAWYDNIPILSYVFLLSKCRQCKGRIKLRYPLVEGLTGALYLFILYRFGFTGQAGAYVLFGSLLLICAFTDLELDDDGQMYLMIPDEITLPGTVAGVLLSFVLTDMTLINSLMGVVVGGGSLYLVMRIVPRGMGDGDTKLAAMMGAFLGWKSVLIGIYLGIILGAVVGVILLVLKIRGRKDAIPFGPFLVSGAVISIFYSGRFISRFLVTALSGS